MLIKYLVHDLMSWQNNLCFWLFTGTENPTPQPLISSQLGAEKDPNGRSMLPTLPDSNLFLQHFQPLPGSLWYFRVSQLSLLLPPSLLVLPHPPSFLLLPHLPPPPLSSRQGIPSKDHCLRSEGPLIVGLGTLGGVDRINPTNSTIWFPLCLMTMLAFCMQPNGLDQICSIDLDARAAGPRQHGHMCTTVQ